MDAAVGPGLTRRQLVATAGLAVVAAALPGTGRLVAPWLAAGRATSSGSAPAPDLSLARFTPHVGSPFTLEQGDAGRATVRLEEATARAPRPADRPGLTGEAFSLLFRAEGPTVAGDGIQTLVHPVLGTFPLFLVAVGRGHNGQGYQAVVDRRAPR